MTAETILLAFNDIDEAFLLEPRTELPPVRRRRRLIILIAAAMTLLIATACAAGEITGVLESFFTNRSNFELTPKQIGYIEENEQLVSDAQKHNGYTVELQSYLATDDTIYVVFGITAPRNVDLAALKYPGMDIEWVGIYGEGGAVRNSRLMEDDDGHSNTINYVYTLQRPHPVQGASTEWHAFVSSVTSIEHDKETNQWEKHTLAEGQWHFIIDLTKADSKTVELLSEPIHTLAIIANPDNHEDVYTETVDDVTVTSFILSPLDATVVYEPPNSESMAHFAGTIFPTCIEFNIYAVMKDGSSVRFSTSVSSSPGESRLLAESPLVLEEVDHVLLADGTKIMVP